MVITGKHNWTRRLGDFLPGYLTGNNIMRALIGKLSIILHGSTTMGIDDIGSDLDLWGLVPGKDLTEVAESSGVETFFEFELGGKLGHINLEPLESFQKRVECCDMDTIFQLRRADVLMDPMGHGSQLVAIASRPMRREVRDALFFWHYTEMRSEHRSMDNPVLRKDAVATMLALAKTLTQAMRSAMLLDSEPFPYDKWLYQVAQTTNTGRMVTEGVNRVVRLVSAGVLKFDNDSSAVLEKEIKTIRTILVEKAQESCINEPWLIDWYLYMSQAEAARQSVRW